MTSAQAITAMTATGCPGSQGSPALPSLTVAALAAAGHHVTGPDDTGCINIAARMADCALLVTGTGTAQFFWTPRATPADPHALAGLAAALLTGRPCPRHPDAKDHNDITLMGIAGMDLRAGGYTVTLNVYTDDYYYDVGAEITVTHPAAPGTAYITDHGHLTWHRDNWHDTSPPPGPHATARAIAATITRAITAHRTPPRPAPHLPPGHQAQ